ncbi:MAG: deoxyribonuclease IV [Acholeplasmatales bacterium]|jgi:deoxyribonuclease-4|nr:deoxyribonuclease IV [Acholeplasmatales bacterium]
MGLIIGSHVGLTSPDYYLGSVREALSYNANAFMIYTRSPQRSYSIPLENLKEKEGKELLESNGSIDVNNIVVHAPYILNFASDDEIKRNFAFELLSDEINRTAYLNINKIVLHPGNATNLNREQSLAWVIEGLNKVIENTKNCNVRILLETMAGKGTEVGIKFEELKYIIDGINNKERIGVCIDTCHMSDAGYDVLNNFDKVLDEFDKVVGISYIKCIHLNDSLNAVSSHKDRHANIGYGYLGFDCLMKIAYNEKLSNIPKILETPYIKGVAPYKYEIEMLRDKKFKEIVVQ